MIDQAFDDFSSNIRFQVKVSAKPSIYTRIKLGVVLSSDNINKFRPKTADVILW